MSIVARLADVPHDIQAVHAGALVEADGMGGTDRAVDSPIRIAGVQKLRPRAAPAVGEHSAQVLRAHGYHDDQIEALRASGVITTHDRRPS